VYKKTAAGTVWARSHVYISPDMNHSNAFVQFALEELVKQYGDEFKKESRTLEHVFCWSDGCAGQFKNKNQFYWLVNSLSLDGGESYVRIAHHFFQSCHGKVGVQLEPRPSPLAPRPSPLAPRPSSLLASQLKAYIHNPIPCTSQRHSGTFG
jgi:hypothetical protein